LHKTSCGGWHAPLVGLKLGVQDLNLALYLRALALVLTQRLFLNCDAVGQRLNVRTHASNLLVTLVLKLPPIGSECVHVALLQLHATTNHDRLLFQPLQRAKKVNQQNSSSAQRTSHLLQLLVVGTIERINLNALLVLLELLFQAGEVAFVVLRQDLASVHVTADFVDFRLEHFFNLHLLALQLRSYLTTTR